MGISSSKPRPTQPNAPQGQCGVRQWWCSACGEFLYSCEQCWRGCTAGHRWPVQDIKAHVCDAARARPPGTFCNVCGTEKQNGACPQGASHHPEIM